MTPADVSVAIPTYGREDVLVATVDAMLRQSPSLELLVVDQTTKHEPPTEERLTELERSGRIQWLRLATPSIPIAMNLALEVATRPIVLFVDDDIVPAENLVDAHAASYTDDSTWAVVGQVIQPGQVPSSTPPKVPTHGLSAFLDFPFNFTEPAFINNAIACNFSVRRSRAIQVGAFDENFVGAAFRFETEFCRRLCAGGGRVLFQPTARIDHLRAPRGGTRAWGSHLSSASPAHGVGDYYFAFRHGMTAETLLYVLWRPLRQVRTRFHLRRPWWIPVKLIGEARAMLMAIELARRGPRFPSWTPWGRQVRS
jgi:GT2 family glycosyltransferase